MLYIYWSTGDHIDSLLLRLVIMNYIYYLDLIFERASDEMW